MNLFGKKKDQDTAKLEETIAGLRQENEILKERFDKMVEREKRALAARQRAHEEVKMLKENLERASQASGRKETEESAGRRRDAEDVRSASDISGVGPGQYAASKAKLFEILKELASIRAERETLLTIYLQSGELPQKSLLQEYPLLQKAVRNFATQTGCAIFHDQNHIIHLLIVPPLAITYPTHQQSTEFNTEPLCKLFDPTHLFLVVIAHAGHGFVMLTSPQEVLSHEEIHTSVKSKHTKGGWSQRRFEQLREEDIKHHTEKMREVIDTMLDRKPTNIIASGDKRILKDLFTDQNTITLRKLDTAPEYIPEKIVREILTTTIHTY